MIAITRYTTVAFALLAMLSGCGGGDPGEGARLPVQWVGQSQGVLVDNATQLLVAGGGATDPLVVGEGELDGQMRERLAAHYRAGHPIVMFDATAAEIGQLRAAVGLTPEYKLPAGVTTVEAYALDASRAGVHELVLLPPSTRPIVRLDPVAESQSVLTIKAQALAPTVESDTEGQQTQRATILADWLKADAQRDTPAAARVPSARSDDGPEITSKFMVSGAAIAHVTEVVVPDGANTHRIKFNAYSFRERTSGESYFYVDQVAMFDPTATMEDQPVEHRFATGRVTYGYELLARPGDGAAEAGVSLRAAGGSLRSYTDMIFGVTGDMVTDLYPRGFYGDGIRTEIVVGWEPPWMGLDGIVSTNSPPASVAWRFRGQEPTSWRVGMICGLDPGTPRRKEQAVLRWAWRAPNSLRAVYPAGLPAATEVVLHSTEITRSGFFGCDISKLQHEARFIYPLVLPWPPQ